MTNKCRCGGRVRNIDPVTPVMGSQGYTVYETGRIRDGYATFRCERCRKLMQQKLRQAAMSGPQPRGCAEFDFI